MTYPCVREEAMVAKRCRFHTQSLRQQATLEESAASQQGLCKHSHAVVAMHGTRQTRGSTCGSFFGCAGAVGGCAYTEHSSAEPDVFCLCACRERECSALHSHPFNSLGGLVATGHYRASGCGKCTETTEGANQTRKVDSARWRRSPCPEDSFAVWWGAH